MVGDTMSCSGHSRLMSTIGVTDLIQMITTSTITCPKWVSGDRANAFGRLSVLLRLQGLRPTAQT
jgi:hypothetical protein